MFSTRIEFCVLIGLLDGPRHGYGIMQDVGEMTAGEVRLGPGTLYSAIKRLLRGGLIEECEADADGVDAIDSRARAARPLLKRRSDCRTSYQLPQARSLPSAS